MSDARRLLTSYASGYGIEEQERIEARLQAIENVVGMTASRKAADNILDALARGGSPNPTLAANLQTLSATGAISVSKLKTQIDSSGGAVTASLAAPSAQDGQLKLITMSDATASSTVSGTNVDAQSGKTAAFSTTAKYLVLMAVGSKWVQIAGNVTWS